VVDDELRIFTADVLAPSDERLGPDLSRGRGKLIGGDLDIATPLLHWLLIRVTQIDLAKKANPYKRNRENKQEQSRCNLNYG
jgi:hypothetical protein